MYLLHQTGGESCLRQCPDYSGIFLSFYPGFGPTGTFTGTETRIFDLRAEL